MHADQEAVLSAEVKGSGEASIHIHYTHIHIQYALTSSSSGEELHRSVRIADCHCNRDDLERETQQYGHASVLTACRQDKNRNLPQPSLSPDHSMRALAG